MLAVKLIVFFVPKHDAKKTVERFDETRAFLNTCVSDRRPGKNSNFYSPFDVEG